MNAIIKAEIAPIGPKMFSGTVKSGPFGSRLSCGVSCGGGFSPPEETLRGMASRIMHRMIAIVVIIDVSSANLFLATKCSLKDLGEAFLILGYAELV